MELWGTYVEPTELARGIFILFLIGFSAWWIASGPIKESGRGPYPKKRKWR